MGRRLLVLAGLGAAAVVLRRKAAEAVPAPATPAPAPTGAPAPPPSAPVASTNGRGSANGHAPVEDEGPHGPGSAAPLADGSAPEGFTVKAKTTSGIYHTETSPSFKRTRADVWFRSAEDAERAGFKRSGADRAR
jgi:hypothetical protein